MPSLMHQQQIIVFEMYLLSSELVLLCAQYAQNEAY